MDERMRQELDHYLTTPPNDGIEDISEVIDPEYLEEPNDDYADALRDSEVEDVEEEEEEEEDE